MIKRNGFLDGLLLGLVAGGIAGLLLAPESGEKTRDKLKKMADKTTDPGSEFSGSETTSEMIQKTKDAIEQGLDRLSKLVNNGKPKEEKAETERVS